jgi:arginyl-tRNA synthetase
MNMENRSQDLGPKKYIESLLMSVVDHLQLTEVSFTVEHPGELAHGDYASNIALVCAKKMGKSPRKVADIIVAEFQKLADPEIIGAVTVAGPGFINIILTSHYFASEIKTIFSQKEKYGQSDRLAGQTWVIEHTSPNPNKAMHLGHLRNNLTGMSISNIALAQGVRVIRDEVDNNRGIAIAKLMWGYLKFARKDGNTEKTDVAYWHEHQNEWKEPKDENLRPDRFVDQLYVKGADDFKSPEIESYVREYVVRWEAGDPLIWDLWKTVLHYSYEGQSLTLKRLGNHWDHVWHEHEHYQKGKDLVEQGLSQGIFRVGEGGAIVTDFRDDKLPDTVLIKSDGTSLYLTQDIALTKLKKETYHADKLFWVIGPEQSLALRQLFRVCSQLGIGNESDYTHLSYGYMSILRNGVIEKMSSRMGNVIYIDDLIDMVKSVVLLKLKDPQDSLAEQVALGAIKFAILFTGRQTDTAFDIDRATNLDGDSGPYLQYTHARILSMISKGNEQGIIPLYQDGREQLSDIERIVYRFPEVVAMALDEYAPNHIATYLIELARIFNSFYAAHKIIDKENPELSSHRLALAQATALILKNGLNLLGIHAPDRM